MCELSSSVTSAALHFLERLKAALVGLPPKILDLAAEVI